MTRYLVDTNVFAYARGGEHHYRDPCRAIVDAAGNGRLTLEASVELVQEHTHLLLRRGVARADALAEVQEVMALCRLHAFDTDVLHRSISLLSAHPQLGVRDAVHAATALHNGIERILTADRVFDGIPGITRVDPTSITTT